MSKDNEFIELLWADWVARKPDQPFRRMADGLLLNLIILFVAWALSGFAVWFANAAILDILSCFFYLACAFFIWRIPARHTRVANHPLEVMKLSIFYAWLGISLFTVSVNFMALSFVTSPSTFSLLWGVALLPVYFLAFILSIAVAPQIIKHNISHTANQRMTPLAWAIISAIPGLGIVVTNTLAQTSANEVMLAILVVSQSGIEG